MAEIIAVLRALLGAAFSTGGITDAQHTDLLGKLDAASQPAEPEAPGDAQPTGDTIVGTAGFGTESHPYA